ncbi:hypothetical protein M434DRAFT_396161 [Hypoxylon sp. CO27-5]|nr:hypothetical protein M434DRAFT_396161 [Hypoxylon sp. CO27-5]
MAAPGSASVIPQSPLILQRLLPFSFKYLLFYISSSLSLFLCNYLSRAANYSEVETDR